MHLKLILSSAFLALALISRTLAQQPIDSGLEKFKPLPAPKYSRLFLKKGDRLAICGDSITEQKMYSRIMEDYLTMCVPQLDITVRQFGWSGEKAPGFLARMTNDCLRFKPTVATTCYGMNDHLYKPYEEQIGKTYREKSAAIDEAFKANGVRMIQGSAGCVGKMPTWVKSANGTVDDLNLNLCTLRNIGIELAEKEKVRFADVFWPMMVAGAEARKNYSPDYAISGKDGVHPGWAGHTVMAYAFLKAFGLDGEIGKLTVDLKSNKMKPSEGHEVISQKNGEFQIKSTRYPFCACVPETNGPPTYPVCANDDLKKDTSIHSGMTLIPFNQELNRFILVAKNGKAGKYRLEWSNESKVFTSEQLAQGINLAAEFTSNPFCEAFSKVDSAVAAKQAYETTQIKKLFRSPGAKIDMEGVAAESEKERAPLAEAIHAAFVPVTHTIKIIPE
jgi:lysophospholipase L1-like esterase